jgi:predicted ATPase/DNA-binding SARP family transcriptional activator
VAAAGTGTIRISATTVRARRYRGRMRFGILGPLAVWTAEAKVRALLVMLLVHDGQVVSVDRLCEVLWGDRFPRNPSGALHTKVWQLRKVLEQAEPGQGGLVESRAPGYRMRMEDCDFDVRQFLGLAARARGIIAPAGRAAGLADALSLWRGDALADFGDEEFAVPTVARLAEQHLAVIEDHADALLELGEHTLLIAELGDLVARHPLRERLRATQMRALYRAGRQSEALQTFDDFRVFLAEGLGLEPSPELVVLRQAILQQDPALAGAAPPVTTSARRQTNLPTALTPLIGRERAIDQVSSLLASSRLVTLNGIGGVGKTRLALALAEHMADTFPDGAWLIELAPVEHTDAAEQRAAIVELVATTLGVRDEAGVGGGPATMVSRLAEALRAKQLLLVLDNCEHLVAPVAELTVALLTAAPGVRVLVTSQDALGVAGERLWTVPALELPDDGDSAARAAAVEFFVARAGAAAPGFRLDETTRDDVFAICRRLDGIPLALELAATRVRALGVHEVAVRLTDRFTLLTAGHRGAPARQQTLRAAIDWSWGLLTEPERVVLRRLAVHVGGCTLSAAEEVCAGDSVETGQVLDIMARLVDRSLVAVTDDATAGPRYRLLESVAAYGFQRLREAGEEEWLQVRFARHHARLVESVASQLYGPDQRRWLLHLDLESANLRRALDVAVSRRLPDLALRLVTGLAWYWFLRGRLGEAARAFAAALDTADDRRTDEWLAAASWRAGFALRTGVTADSVFAWDSAWELCDGIGDDRLRARARWFLCLVQLGFGDQERRLERAEQALAELTALGDAWGVAAALSARATQALLHGELSDALRNGEQSLTAFRAVGDGWGQLQATHVLAQLAEIQGDYDRSGRLHLEGLRIAEALGLWTDVSIKLSGLGRIALLRHRHEEATELHERAMRLASEQGFPFGEQFAEVGLGLGARRTGDFAAAEVHLSHWLDWCRQMFGEPGTALILAELGFAAEQQGRLEVARWRHLEGLAAARQADDPRAVALAVEGLAGVCAASGDHRAAAMLLGSATAARLATGAPLPSSERGDVDRIRGAAEAALGPAAFDADFGRGTATAMDEAVEQAFAEPAVG